MKILMGVLCLASYITTASAYIPFQSNLEAQTPANVATDSQVAIGNRAEEEKATTLIVVWTKGCRPCQKMKAWTIPSLKAQGYDVSGIYYQEWNKDNPYGEVFTFPTLLYFDEYGRKTYEEIGFRRPDQVKKYLAK